MAHNKHRWGLLLSLLFISCSLPSYFQVRAAPGSFPAGDPDPENHSYFFPQIYSENIAPTARINVTVTSGTAPLGIQLNGWGSKDIDGSLAQYSWDFGDGQSGQNVIESHEYRQPGLYEVSLTVTDNRGGTDQAQITVRVNEPAFATKNVILFIGDGMGFEQVKAGGLYQNGEAGSLSFEAFPFKAQVTTSSASSSITDSAAAATAIATGFKVNNGVLSLVLPGDGSELYTMLEYARDQGMSTGLVTNTTITNATPAAFGAHTDSRKNVEEVAFDYLNQTRPNVLMGGGGDGMTVNDAQAAEYQVITDLNMLLALQTENYPTGPGWVSGQFGIGPLPFIAADAPTLPVLPQMTTAALNVLDNDPDGFFLMVEGARIDHAGHANATDLLVGEVIEFSESVREAIEWAKTHPGTLIVVTADHETGGLQILNGNGQGNLPTVTWSTTGHTGVDIPLYMEGPFKGELPPVVDNTHLAEILSDGKFPGTP